MFHLTLKITKLNGCKIELAYSYSGLNCLFPTVNVKNILPQQDFHHQRRYS